MRKLDLNFGQQRNFKNRGEVMKEYIKGLLVCMAGGIIIGGLFGLAIIERL